VQILFICIILLILISQWIEKIFVPYRERVIESDPDLNDDQMSILYPVHIGKDFQCYVWDEHPYIILIFIPANCKFQII
jgi:hypothetical protein